MLGYFTLQGKVLKSHIDYGPKSAFASYFPQRLCAGLFYCYMEMTHAPRIDAVCLDLDGTLYSQAELRKAMAVRLLRNLCFNPRRGYRVLRILSVYRHSQECLRGKVPDCDIGEAQVKLTCQRTGASREEVVVCIKVWFEDAPLPLLRRSMRRGLIEFLWESKARNIKLAVVSDYPAAAKLNALGIASYFDVVVCAQDPDVQRFKPDPTSLRVALERLGVERENALYVGDRPCVDGEAARLAGVQSAIVGDRKPERGSGLYLTFRDFNELAAVILQ